jgi:hypothetical protein
VEAFANMPMNSSATMARMTLFWKDRYIGDKDASQNVSEHSSTVVEHHTPVQKTVALILGQCSKCPAGQVLQDIWLSITIVQQDKCSKKMTGYSLRLTSRTAGKVLQVSSRTSALRHLVVHYNSPAGQLLHCHVMGFIFICLI